MELILKIAWRNILRHKGKSLIIGMILFLGALLMTFGNGVISGMNRGLETNIVNGFMGDIVIIPDKEKSDNILFKMMGESIGTITNYKDIKKVLEKEKYLDKYLPAGKNASMVINEDEGDPGYAYLIGVDFKQYREFFPENFYPIEGRLLKDNETGIIVADTVRKDIYDQTGMWIIPEDGELVEKNLSDGAKASKKDLLIKKNLVFLGFNDGNSTSDIRLGIKGIIKFKALNTIWGHFSFMDIESYRQCLGYFSAADLNVEISKEKKDLLSKTGSDLDSMFASDSVIVADRGNADISNINFKRKELSTTEGIDLESGAYNLVFVKLKKGTSQEDGVEKLNKALKEAKLGVRAVTWKKAAGPIGNMASIIKGALFTFVMFLFIVAIIIIVNTLTMAAIERTTEIGMMRAIGAEKKFISAMFLGETSMLSGVFGGAGIITGIIIVKIIPLLKITSDNDMVQLLYGGDTFHPFLSGSDIFLAVFQLLLVTLITVIYPVKVAKNITPLDAISRD